MKSQKTEYEMRAYAYSLFSSLLLNEPHEDTLAAVSELATSFDAPAGIKASLEMFSDVESAQEAFYQRTILAATARYFPFCEQSVRTAHQKEGVWRPGPLHGSYETHVIRCYKHAGFDYEKVEPTTPIAAPLKADSLIAECAFMAYLLDQAAHAEEASEQYSQYAQDFLESHLSTWVTRGADILISKGSDYYAYTVALCAAFIASDAEAYLA